jgi:hypothetical protein
LFVVPTQRVVFGVLWVMSSVGWSACDHPDTTGTDPATNATTLSTVVRPPSPADPAATVVEPPATPPLRPIDDPSDYDRMCRHYCGMLQDTLIFYCVGAGDDAATCQHTAATTVERCFELRCSSKRVTQSLCFTQCDSLATQYDFTCAAITAANESVCTSPSADHDRACREGCGPAAP